MSRPAFQILRYLPLLAAFPVAGILAINFLFVAVGWGHLYDRVEDLPYCRVALVLGTSKYLGTGLPSPYFEGRMEAAHAIWQDGKADFLLLSGDNQFDSYNEPIRMKQALKQAGVPEDRLVLDFAGFSTLDSVLRARKVFGQDELIVVSQDFQNERAVFIASFSGVRVEALNARGGSAWSGIVMSFRELFARTKAFLDVVFLDTPPRFLGEAIEIR